MQIVMVTPEVAPFSKEGGLADVLGALPPALEQLGEDVRIISPLYRGVRERAKGVGVPLEPVPEGQITVPIGDAMVQGRTWQSVLPGSNVGVYFLENDRYYDRDGYYTKRADNSDFQDNSERFIYLSRGAMELCRTLGLEPDILHSHDWPTGLVPIYLKYIYTADFPDTASVFTIHNIAYQGIFWHWDMNLAGLPWELFTWRMLEYYGNLSFLKAGLVGADALTTVSRTYSKEIQTEEQGCGMHGVLQERSADLYGVINGIDGAEWNPSTDPHIEAKFSADDLSGKAACKAALQNDFGLEVDPNVPLVGMVCRLVDQKGLDILAEALPQLTVHDIQFAVLGRGDPQYHDLLSEAQARHPGRFSVLLDYDDAAAHRIEAGADMFLMPSRFEPCGLNQLYSMVYGAVPIVRATGGLADTVTDYTEEDLASGGATGFVFRDYSAAALIQAVMRAVDAYRHGETWRRLMRNGMGKDWSWRRSAAEYLDVYEKAREKAGEQHGKSPL